MKEDALIRFLKKPRSKTQIANKFHTTEGTVLRSLINLLVTGRVVETESQRVGKRGPLSRMYQAVEE